MCFSISLLRISGPWQTVDSQKSKVRSKDIDHGLAGWEHSFAEQEQRMKSVAAFLGSVLHGIPERHPPLAFEFGQLNPLDRRVVPRTGVDRQPWQEHGRYEILYV